MASLFQRLGLVEVVDNKPEKSSASIESTVRNTEVEVDTTSLQEEENVITAMDIYGVANISDLTKSVYKVKELCDTLPKEMSTESKRETVLSIMRVSQLSVQDVVSDGEQRLEVLKGAETNLVSAWDTEIFEANDEIENLKLKIEQLQKEIALNKSQKETLSKNIKEEVEMISEYMTFVGGNK